MEGQHNHHSSLSAGPGTGLGLQFHVRVDLPGESRPMHLHSGDTSVLHEGNLWLCMVQEKKRLVFEGTVGGSAESLAKLTEDDMKFLFS